MSWRSRKNGISIVSRTAKREKARVGKKKSGFARVSRPGENMEVVGACGSKDSAPGGSLARGRKRGRP